MATKDIFIFKPINGSFAPEQIKMWEVLEPHIKAQVHQLPLPDLLLFAYLLGLGHMQDALEQDKKLAIEFDTLCGTVALHNNTRAPIGDKNDNDS